MSNSYVQRRNNEKAMLYRVVYEFRSVKIAALFLCAFFLLQGAAPAFAAEEEVAESEAVAPVATPEKEEVVEEEVLEASLAGTETQEEEMGSVEENNEATATSEETQEDVIEETADTEVAAEVVQDLAAATPVIEPEADTEEVGEVSNENMAEGVLPEVADEGETASSSEEQSEVEEDTASSTTETAGGSSDTIPDTLVEGEEETTTTSTSQPGEVNQPGEELMEETEQVGTSEETTDDTNGVVEEEQEEQEDAGDAQETDDYIEESVASSTELIATSTEETATSSDVVYVQTSLVNDSNRYQFSVDECVSVGDESFYCNNSNTTGSVDAERIVFAAPDSDGDQEIFFNTGKKILQITSNQYDDEAPEYDAESHSIVWHRLIDGRYQIMSYNIDKEEEEQLTDTHTNNMEPSREGAVVVFQRWVDNNWEIVLYENGVEKQLTENETHDLAPDIQGGYIVWHTSDTSGERQVAVYEVATGLLSRIADNGGGQVVNPRFVLVYDTKFDNGDVITKGFDPETGKLIPLAAQPGEEPIDIPDADPTGETRALINTKSSGREDSLEKLVLQPIATTTNGVEPVATSSSDILMETADTASTTPEVIADEVGVLDLSTTTPAVEETLQLTEYDVIVEPYEEIATTTSTQSNNSTSTEEIVE